MILSVQVLASLQQPPHQFSLCFLSAAMPCKAQSALAMQFGLVILVVLMPATRFHAHNNSILHDSSESTALPEEGALLQGTGMLGTSSAGRLFSSYAWGCCWTGMTSRDPRGTAGGR